MWRIQSSISIKWNASPFCARAGITWSLLWSIKVFLWHAAGQPFSIETISFPLANGKVIAAPDLSRGVPDMMPHTMAWAKVKLTSDSSQYGQQMNCWPKLAINWRCLHHLTINLSGDFYIYDILFRCWPHYVSNQLLAIWRGQFKRLYVVARYKTLNYHLDNFAATHKWWCGRCRININHSSFGKRSNKVDTN